MTNDPDPVEAAAKAMFDNAQTRRFKADDAEPAERWEDQVGSRKKPWLSDAEVAIAALAVKGRGNLHTAIMDVLNKAILAEHPGAFHEESESDIVIPAKDAIAYVQISTSQLAEVILPIVEPLRLAAQPEESGCNCGLTGENCHPDCPHHPAPPAPDAVEREGAIAAVETFAQRLELCSPQMAGFNGEWLTATDLRLVVDYAKAAEILAVPGSVGVGELLTEVADVLERQSAAAKRANARGAHEWEPAGTLIDRLRTAALATPPRGMQGENFRTARDHALARPSPLADDGDVEDGEATRGRIVWLSSGEDEGPDCGMSVGLGGGRVLFAGELAKATVEASGVEMSRYPDEWWVAVHDATETVVIAAVADRDAAKKLIQTIASSLSAAPSRAAPAGDREGWQDIGTAPKKDHFLAAVWHGDRAAVADAIAKGDGKP